MSVCWSLYLFISLSVDFKNSEFSVNTLTFFHMCQFDMYSSFTAILYIQMSYAAVPRTIYVQ